MIQTIRQKVFETNSSTEHAIVITKDDKNIEEIPNKALIPIMQDTVNISDPFEILSYVYTQILLSHCWEALDKLKETFPNYIFEKPQWDLPYESVDFYCDDREVISFCDLISSSMSAKYTEEQLIYIANNIKEIMQFGKVFILYDTDIIGELSSLYEQDGKEWIDAHVKEIIQS